LEIIMSIMSEVKGLSASIFEGWHLYQSSLTTALAPLDADQLALRAAPNLRSVSEIAAHIIGARARWFYSLMEEGGEEFQALGKWDRRGARQRTAQELVRGLKASWVGMHEAIARWTAEDWEMTWPGEDASEPEVITRQWVIWHLIEHDVHHGGEISITLGAHGVPALRL
jgi:uncharacterized damage-inducible protein DinB